MNEREDLEKNEGLIQKNGRYLDQLKEILNGRKVVEFVTEKGRVRIEDATADHLKDSAVVIYEPESGPHEVFGIYQYGLGFINRFEGNRFKSGLGFEVEYAYGIENSLFPESYLDYSAEDFCNQASAVVEGVKKAINR
jgi:hypothetical protein